MDRAPILATKLFIPPLRPNFVARPRLLARLEAVLRVPLTVLAAPAGWGKTTALAAWCAAAAGDTRVAWVSLDAGDNDLVRFWTYVLTALNAAQPGVAEEALAFLHASQPPAIEAVLTLLLNAVAALPRDVVLVLDDYHLITATTVHTSVTYLLEHIPSRFHLVVTSREDPPLPLARFRAGGRLCELRAVDLRFTAEEAATFLTETAGLPLGRAAMEALDTRTEGWIAGLQLAALSVQGRSVEQAGEFIAAFGGSNRYIVDYLVEEVLARQPPEFQTFLLRTAVLDRFCAPLCDVLLANHADAMTSALADVGDVGDGSGVGTPLVVPSASGSGPHARGLSAEAILERLDRANLFLIPLDDDRHWYRYHHLFADVLRSWPRQADPGLYAELHRRASAWFEGQNLVEEAVGHALAAADFEHAADLIERHGAAVAAGGQHETVLGWLRALPAALVRASPLLCACNAIVRYLSAASADTVQVSLREADAAIADRLRGGAAEQDLRQVLGELALVRALVAGIVGDHAANVSLAQDALDRLPETDSIWRAMAQAEVCESYELTGDVTGVTEAKLTKHLATVRTAGNLQLAQIVHMDLGHLQRLQGRLRSAATTYEEAIRAIPSALHLEDLLAGPGIAFGLGTVRLESGDLDGAERLLARGMRMLAQRGGGTARTVTLGYLAQARLAQARGDATGALATLDTFAELSVRYRFALPWSARGTALQAHLHLVHGNLTEAVRWADASGLSSEDAELPFLRESAYLALVRVRIAQGRGDSRGRFLREAERLLERLLADAEAKGRGRSVLEILVLRALAQRAHRDPGGALRTLARALELAAPEGYVRLFADEGAPMAALLTDLIEAAEQRRLALPQAVLEYARFLLGVCRPLEGGSPNPRAEHLWALQPPHAASGVAPLLDPLTERELEVLRLLAEGASNAAIAATLVVTVGTVKKHVFHVCSKLGAQNRTQAVARGRALHLL